VHRYHRAILDYDQAIKLRPDFAEAFYNLGYAHYQAQLYHHAIEDFDRFIKLRPDFANAFEIRSFVKRAIGDLKGAEDDATRAKQLWRRR
jgi:tetratricopeptide (TPR) repeat protein